MGWGEVVVRVAVCGRGRKGRKGWREVAVRDAVRWEKIVAKRGEKLGGSSRLSSRLVWEDGWEGGFGDGEAWEESGGEGCKGRDDCCCVLNEMMSD